MGLYFIVVLIVVSFLAGMKVANNRLTAQELRLSYLKKETERLTYARSQKLKQIRGYIK